jgi:hypothetical protein
MLRSFPPQPVGTSAVKRDSAETSRRCRRHSVDAIHDESSRFRSYQSMTSNPLGSTSRLAVDHKERNHAAHLGVTYARAGDIRAGGSEAIPLASSYAGLASEKGANYAPRTSLLQRGTAFDALAAESALRHRITDRLELVLRAQGSIRPPHSPAAVPSRNPLRASPPLSADPSQ